MDKLIIRQLTLDDNLAEAVQAINPLLLQLSAKAEPITKEHLKFGLGQRNYFLLVAKDCSAEKPVWAGMGLIYFSWRPEGWIGWIHSVVVDHEYRGKGIGKMLVQELIKIAEDFASQVIRQNVKVYLTSRPSRVEANAIYKRLNFRQVAVANTDETDGTNLYAIAKP